MPLPSTKNVFKHLAKKQGRVDEYLDSESLLSIRGSSDFSSKPPLGWASRQAGKNNGYSAHRDSHDILSRLGSKPEQGTGDSPHGYKDLSNIDNLRPQTKNHPPEKAFHHEKAHFPLYSQWLEGDRAGKSSYPVDKRYTNSNELYGNNDEKRSTNDHERKERNCDDLRYALLIEKINSNSDEYRQNGHTPNDSRQYGADDYNRGSNMKDKLEDIVIRNNNENAFARARLKDYPNDATRSTGKLYKTESRSETGKVTVKTKGMIGEDKDARFETHITRSHDFGKDDKRYRPSSPFSSPKLTSTRRSSVNPGTSEVKGKDDRDGYSPKPERKPRATFNTSASTVKQVRHA